MKILLVDDSKKDRLRFLACIEDLGHEVVTKVNGIAATQTLSHDSTFHAIITDREMPVMDGIKLLQDLDQNNYRIPTLLHSSENSCMSFGTDIPNLADFVEKYFFSFAEFHLKDGSDYIQKFLKKVEASHGNSD